MTPPPLSGCLDLIQLVLGRKLWQGRGGFSGGGEDGGVALWVTPYPPLCIRCTLEYRAAARPRRCRGLQSREAAGEGVQAQEP